MKTARIVEGKIAEILNPIPGFTLSECFHPDILSQCKQVADEAQVGDDYVAPVETPIETPVETPTQGETNVSAPTDGTS